MYSLQMETDALIARLTKLQMKALPGAMVGAINQAAFAVRGEWARQMPEIFDAPTRLTANAPLYKSATKETLAAEVYIRNVVGSGAAPSEYLRAEAFGGARRMKHSEQLLGHFYVPAHGVKLDRYGNVPSGTIRAILTRTGGRGPVRPGIKRTVEGKRAKGKNYFIQDVTRGRMKAGVYQRLAKGRVIRILTFVNAAPVYRKRFDGEKLARTIFNQQVGKNFRNQLYALLKS